MKLPWRQSPEDLDARMVFVDTIRPKFWHVQAECARADEKLKRIPITQVSGMSEVYSCQCVPEEVERESFEPVDIVLGWKTLVINDYGGLSSPNQSTAWGSRVFEARCGRTDHNFSLGCHCGIYAWTLETKANQSTDYGPRGLHNPDVNRPNVVLSFAGIVEVTEYGFRAERARIEEIHLNERNRGNSDALYRRYGVPILVHPNA